MNEHRIIPDESLRVGDEVLNRGVELLDLGDQLVRELAI